MKNAFIKFCQEIDFNISKNLEGSVINSVHFNENKENDNIKIFVDFDVCFFSIPSKEEFNEFIEKTRIFFKNSEINFNISFLNKNYSSKKIFEILEYGAQILKMNNVSEYLEEKDINFDISNNVLNIEFGSMIRYTDFKKNIDIDKIISFFDINDIKVSIINKSEINFQNEIDEIEKKAFQDLLEIKEKQKNFLDQKNKSSKQNNGFFNQKSKKYFKVSLEDFYVTNEQFVFVEAKVFDIEETITKTNLKIKAIYITDGNEAIVAKKIVRNGENDDTQWIEKNMSISIYGEKKQEFNSSSYFLNINKVDKIEKNESKIELLENERIEFLTKTSMSAMNGFISAEKMLKHAKKIGHKAIGFADFQNIQSFPEIYNNAKKIGIKPIYGSTFTIINKKNELISNVKIGKDISLEKYVVFDLETTSLNPRIGEIIEFGAVVVENKKIVEKIQFFVKPTEPISKFTTELTGIDQKMIDENFLFDNQKDAINKILEIFKDYTLVAHNASFDIGYINEKMYQYNMGQIENQIIDTLAIAKYLFPVSQSYRLEIVAKKTNISYDPTIAHRADYDANILEQVWISMIDLLESKNIKTFEDIQKIDSQWLNEKKFGDDITVYAKNQEGLKELFKLVSLSLTKNFFNGPKIFEEDLAGLNNVLVGPTSTNSRLMNLMQTGTSIEIEKEIKKWDFIGIPSPHLFSHLVHRQNFNQNELEIMLKDIIIKSKKQNKLIIATGDVHYLDEEDALAHAIYINTKGIEGRRHPLYKYNEFDPKYPILKYLTTKEMIDNFNFLNSEDLAKEIVITNTHTLNSMINDNIEVIKSKLYPPKFDNSEINLKKIVYENAKKIYGENLPTIVENRIKRELEPITKYGFSVIYWISQKLVAKSLSDGYLVGSRGSVGSSIVATLSGITEVNPLPPHYICKQCKKVEFVEKPKTTSGFDLEDKKCDNCNLILEKNGQTIPFETFLGFDGDKTPDIDLNFSGDYQPIIHQEVRKIFGEDHSFRAGTISTVASKTAFGFVKKYFEELGISKSNHFVSFLAKKIEGSKRTTGQHPGGIIIIPKEFDVEDFTPINYPANDINSTWKTTHFDFHAIHDNVLKLDLLGHDDPTAIRQLQKLTNVKISDISFSDKKVLELFSSTDPLGIKPEDINNEPTGVLGIPEFGTKFVRRMLKVAKPKSFNDLINISGLSHGTDVWNDNAETLVKEGKSLNEVISCRDDIMVYLMNKKIDPLTSFQIMENVRKGKGLKENEEKLLKENGIENWYINSLNKIKYMFPKAHATAYVMMAWRIAWFKIYYPLEYYATFFTVRSDVFDIESSIGSKSQVENRLKELEKKQFSKDPKDKITAKEEELITIFEIINEMMARNIKISNINLYESDSNEWKIDYENNCLIPPFIVLDGLGGAAAKSIVEARKIKRFSSKDDLLRRTQINKTVLEKMDKMGIIKNLEETDQIKLF